MFSSSFLKGPELRPASKAAAKQLVIFLHGYGSSGNDLISLAPLLGEKLPDCHFLAPNGPEICSSSPNGYQWFGLENRAEGAMYRNVNTVYSLLEDYVREQSIRLEISFKNIALVGFSQGTMTSLHVALRFPFLLGGVLGYSGALLGPDILEKDIKQRPPVCLVHGIDDLMVPYTALQSAETALKKNAVPVETVSCKDLGHSINREGIDTGISFLKKQFFHIKN